MNPGGLADRLAQAATTLESIAPAIVSSADKIKEAKDTIAKLVQGSQVPSLLAAPDNCAVACRFFIGHGTQAYGASDATGAAADLLRSVIGRVGPG